MRPLTGIDTETGRFSRGNLAPRLVCYQWANEYGAQVVHHTTCKGVIETHFSTPGWYLVGHNVAFDLSVLMAFNLGLIDLIFDKLDRDEIGDTQLAQQLIDIADGSFAFRRQHEGAYTLETTAGRYGIVKNADDPWRLRYGELIDTPVNEWPKEAYDYALHDPVTTVQTFEKQLVHITYLGNLGAQTRAALIFQLASVWGVHTDEYAVKRLHTEVERMLDEARTVLFRGGLVDAKGKRNTKPAKELAYKAYIDQGLTPKWTKKGLELDPSKRDASVVSLDADSCMLTGLDVLRAYAMYTSATSLRGRVKDLFEGFDYPLQARFNTLMETGRSSSSKPKKNSEIKGTQLQNFPRALISPLLKKHYTGATDIGVRECLVPRDGYAFVGADVSSAELHTVSQICLDLFGQSALADNLNKGVDVHLLLGALSAGYSYEYALAHKEDEKVQDDRQQAKPANFGYWGGMGAPKFVLYSRAQWDVVFTVDEARAIKDHWFSITPEARVYFRWVSEALSGRDYMQIKQFRVDRYRGRTGFCDTCNGYFQSLAADGIKAAWYEVGKACYKNKASPLYGSRPWNLVHDEILLETPLDLVHDAAMELSRIMEREFNKFVPDVPTTAEPVAMMCWSKKAKPVYEKGRLIPWINQ